MEAVRWGLYARRVAPLLAAERAMAAMTSTGLKGARKLEVAAEQLRAGRNVPILEALLYPKDSDGD